MSYYQQPTNQFNQHNLPGAYNTTNNVENSINSNDQTQQTYLNLSQNLESMSLKSETSNPIDPRQTYAIPSNPQNILTPSNYQQIPQRQYQQINPQIASETVSTSDTNYNLQYNNQYTTNQQYLQNRNLPVSGEQNQIQNPLTIQNLLPIQNQLPSQNQLLSQNSLQNQLPQTNTNFIQNQTNSSSIQNRYPNQNYYQPNLSQPPNLHNQYGQSSVPQQNYYDRNQYPSYNSPVQQQNKVLDPDNIPSVIQVDQDDKEKFFNNEMVYYTTVPSDIPPNDSTINNISNHYLNIVDRGNARPNHIRSSIYNVPLTEEVLKTTCIPFNVIIKPFDEGEINKLISVPISNSEILRCNRCKAYMSPFMRFTDGGNRFQCSMCHHINKVNQSYFSPLDHTGQRLDKYERPELHLGSYEFRTTEEFYRNKVMASRRPHIIFAFELTKNSKFLINNISANLAEVIKTSLPYDKVLNFPSPLVGFITYNSKIQLYDIVNDGISHIICDISNTFSPFTTFLVDPLIHMDKIEKFLLNLPKLYSESDLETETILGPVIEAAFQTCNADESNWFSNQKIEDKSKVIPVGKIYLFHCTLPTYGEDETTPGRLKQRWITTDDEAKRLLGTDKEKIILTPESSKYYTKLGEKCVSEYGSGVELFLFPPVNGSYLDIASLSELTRLTGSGGIYKYYNDYSTRFLSDLKMSLKSTIAFDITLKVRTSTGIRPVEYIGNYYSHGISDIQLASLNTENSISVEFKYDDKLPEDEFAIIQVAILYTAISGDRRVRVHNLALPVCRQVAEVFKGASCDTLINHLFRTSLHLLKSGEKTIQQVKEENIKRVVQILTSYRRHCAAPSSSMGQLILPEALKLLPVYLTGLLKTDAIDGGPEMTPDDKAYTQAKALGYSCSYSQVMVYPSLLCIEYDVNSDKLITVPLRCSILRLENQTGLSYILENGFYLFLYLPENPNIPNRARFLKNIFGVDSLRNIKPEEEIPFLDTEESKFLHQLLNKIRVLRKLEMKVFIIRENLDKSEVIFKNFLYEDKKTVCHPSAFSHAYVELLCHLHKEIRNSIGN